MEVDAELKEAMAAISNSLLVTNALLASILDVLLEDKPEEFKESARSSLESNLQQVMSIASDDGLDAVMSKLNEEKHDGCGHCE